jgi:hypothetical protein
MCTVEVDLFQVLDFEESNNFVVFGQLTHCVSATQKSEEPVSSITENACALNDEL